MCENCGCGNGDFKISSPGEITNNHLHDHGHHHEHSGAHDPVHDDHIHVNGRIIKIEQDVLQKNNLLAERNRGYFEAKNILAINLVSSPGSGKTTFLEKTIGLLGSEVKLSVIEGDQQTNIDAERIKAAGANVLQINTGNGCHLDAGMIYEALRTINPPDNSVLFIENVGNLVCPALFDLGEKIRVLIISVTEGEDKPLKYPLMFRSAQLCVINKTDLLPYLKFDIEQLRKNALHVNSKINFIELSSLTGEGFTQLINWIKSKSLPL